MPSAACTKGDSGEGYIEIKSVAAAAAAAAVPRQTHPPVTRAILFADTSAVSYERGIRFNDSLRLLVNLTLFRARGFRFDHFSARVGIPTSATATATATATRGCGATDKIKFQLYGDDSTTSLARATIKHGLNRSKEIEANVANVSILKLVAESKASGRDCSLVGGWADAKLTQGRPLFPACLKRCIPFGKRGKALLSCFVGTCPDRKIVRSLSGIMTSTRKKSRDIRLGWPPSAADSSINTIATRATTTATATTLTFNLTAIRQLGYAADVFVADVKIAVNSCDDGGGGDNRGPPRPDGDQTTTSVVFGIRTGGALRYQKTVREGETARIIFPVEKASAVTLRTSANAARNKPCAYGLWTGAMVAPYEPLLFLPCNEKRCREQIAAGNIYLSCFVGVCSGDVTTKSHEPFFRIDYATHGIGADCPNRESGGKSKRARFQRFEFGLGARPESRVAFDLDAFRQHGLQFKSFIVKLAIDKSSTTECRDSNTSGSVFRVYLDDEIALKDVRITRLGTAKQFLIDVRGIRKLKLVTLNLFGSRCNFAAWGMARLSNLEPPSFSF